MDSFYYWLGKLRRVLWLTSLVSVIGLALLLTLARQLLPYASEYKTEIEQKMSEVFQRPVKVGEVDARLQDFYPTLVLRDVSIIDEQSQKVLFNFDEVYAGLSLIKSIRLKQPVFVNLGLKGTQIAIERNKEGEVKIKGLDVTLGNNGHQDNPDESIRRTLGWLFAQRSLEINDAHIYFRDEASGREVDLPKVNALFRNLAKRHQVNASILLNPADGGELSLAMDLRGSAEDFKNLQGDVYIAAQQLQLKPWLLDTGFKDVRIQEGMVDVQLWSQWQWLELQSVQAEVSLANTSLSWKQQKDIAHINQLDTLLLFEHRPQGWALDIAKLSGTINDEQLIPTRIRLHRNEEGVLNLESSTLQLETLATMGLKLPWLSDEQKERIRQLKPQGEIYGLFLSYDPQRKKPIEASFNINQLGIEAHDKTPYLRGISGAVWLDNDSGTFLVNGTDVRFHQTHAYRQPWEMEEMRGRVDWYVRGDGLHILSDRLDTNAHDFRVQSRFHLVVPNNGAPPLMDMYSRFEHDDVSNLSRYYPVNKIKPGLLHWLDNAFVSGKIYNGQMIHYGRVKKGNFPFLKHQGNFEVAFQTDKVRINYQDGWPHATRLDAKVNFVGNSMHLSTQSASLFNGLRVRDMDLNIADFKHATLKLQGKVKGTTQPAIDFVMQSPLAESMGTALKYVEGRGDIYLDIALQIPLQEGTTKPTTYQGQLRFSDNILRINMDDGYLEADKFNGVLDFTEREYKARNMQAQILEHQASFNVDTYFQGERSSVVIQGHGTIDAKALARETKVWVFDYLYGQTDYEFTTVINNLNNYYQSSYMRLNSDTKGVYMNMPYPVYKEAYQERELLARWDIDRNVVNVRWGEDMETSMSFADADKGGYLNRLALTMGKDEHQLPQQESIYINGSLDRFSLKEWSRVFNKELSSPSKMGKILPLDVRLQSVVLTDLDYQPDKSARRVEDFNVERFPNINFNVKKLIFKEQSMGELQLQLQSSTQGIQLKTLQLNHPLLNINADGEWQMAGSAHTRLAINIKSKNSGGLLKMFGYQATLSGGELQAAVNLKWDDELYNFRLEDLEGDIAFTINQGTILEVEPGVGKMMGLFSFQALPRRLALDFTDLFSSGFTFDQIRGKFVIENGEAISDNIIIQSPSARVVMSGKSGLIRRDYDYDVIIIPGDGSNLFMAGLLAGGIQTGFVVWAIDRMVRVDKYTRLIYHLGGTWDKPVITNLGEAKAKKDEVE